LNIFQKHIEENLNKYIYLLSYFKRQIFNLSFNEPRDEKAELKAFFKEIKKFNLDNIISIDETSVSTLENQRFSNLW